VDRAFERAWGVAWHHDVGEKVRAEGRDESDLEWSDASMRQTGCKNTAKHTLGVAGRVVGGQTKMTGGVTDSLMHELIGHPTCHTV